MSWMFNRTVWIGLIGLGAVFGAMSDFAQGYWQAAVLSNPMHAQAHLVTLEGDGLGTAEMIETPAGVRIKVALDRVPAGAYSFRLVQANACVSMGDPASPSQVTRTINARRVGSLSLPTIHAGADGRIRADILTDKVTLHHNQNGLVDASGASLLIAKGFKDILTPNGTVDYYACGRVDL